MGDVLFRRGDPASVRLDQVVRSGSSVLAIGWHGELNAGRAPVFSVC